MTWTGRLRFVLLAAATSLVTAGCLVEPYRATPLGRETALTFVDGRAADLDGAGTQVIEYDQGEEISLAFAVTADPSRALVLTGFRLGDTKPSVATPLGASVDGRALPVHLAGGERTVVTVRARLDGCPHRGTEAISAVVVDVIDAGRAETWRLPIDRDVVIRGRASCQL